MNKRPHTGHKRVNGRRPTGRPGGAHRPSARRPRPVAREEAGGGQTDFRVVERQSQAPTEPGPFRVVIAVHRPRFRGRAQRAAALTGWEVTALLNKQDPVGLCAKGPRPPDLLILSGDFGRQKDLAIFRAVQGFREMGMRLIGLVDDCAAAPEGFPDSAPNRICDVCLEPPFKTADLRALFSRLYTQMRGVPAPPPVSKAAADAEENEDE